ncbi:4-hydroxy-tetrahydrodipicolinate synthase [Nitratireductor sp. ZSWI3]|uniref:4-hydroxy-tetrahydrodipicolinate synthase n=1 Tax=Nitratireductor sp. ZSWI3 TaxID=2966359 RepID=UPI00214F7E4C|nr:4-hydroxy-tetrahydrodipicolinate synthase [Nitratireductor sp. ZSWI3]MCR4267211.1 4-hydroxy-tetrahydrodipicolinate synthase [Nitratireductor sp. ZSWI3]
MTLTMNDLSGLFTAIVTPFTDDGSVDFDALRSLVRFQMKAGATGIVPIGGTGEYPALSRKERADIVRACVEAAEGAPVLPGVLSTGFADAVEAGRDFVAAGASGVMTVTPYYAAGTQEGMAAYFRNYRDAVGAPVLAYEIPRRTGVALKAETIAELAADAAIIGMKCSSYDMPEFIKTIKLAGDKMAILSGEEPLFATHVALGAKGGVLASATVYPHHWIKVFRAAQAGRLEEAIKLQQELDPVIDTIYLETNPGPLKHYMRLAGMSAGGVRLPLTDPSGETIAALERAFARMKEAEAA